MLIQASYPIEETWSALTAKCLNQMIEFQRKVASALQTTPAASFIYKTPSAGQPRLMCSTPNPGKAVAALFKPTPLKEGRVN